MNPESWRIFKYELRITGEQEIEMPQGARILSIQMQSDHLCIWALVDDNAPKVNRLFLILGTGHEASRGLVNDYLATVQDQRGLVWHVFEIVSV